jgi:hypothetical protein
MKKMLPALLFMTVFLAAGAWWYQQSNSDPLELPPPGTGQSVVRVGDQTGEQTETISEQAVTGEDETQEDDAQVAKAGVKRIVLVPDNRPEGRPPEEEIDTELKQAIQKLVDSSIGGTVEDSIHLARLMNECGSVPRNETQFQNNLQSMKEKFRPGKKRFSGLADSGLIENVEQYEAHMHDRFIQCRAVRSVLNKNLHQQIAELAAGGDTIARYLYAMWPPSLGGRFRIGKMPEWLEYQNLALEYTWQNIDAGEPLGLLAYGQSFNNIDGGFFTPTNYRYAQVFFLAAKMCGLESNWLETELNEYVVTLGKDLDGLKLDRAEIRAEELVVLFCQ